jgi:protein SCO1/2
VKHRAVIAAAALAAGIAQASGPDPAAPAFDADRALRQSQAAIGRELDPGLRFVDEAGRSRTLGEFRGRPLVISPIYTSCFGVCPTTTTELRKVAEIATGVLGPDAFRVLTIGFDTANDTPQRMRSFAASRGAFPAGWVFGAADAATVGRLLDAIGFTYAATPKGFDHMIQATVVDGDGVVYRQVYGQQIEPPQFVDPLKRLALGQRAQEDTLGAMIEGVRLFCTVFDPKSGRYRFDWSVVLSFAIGVLCFTAIAAFLWRSFPRSV